MKTNEITEHESKRPMKTYGKKVRCAKIEVGDSVLMR